MYYTMFQEREQKMEEKRVQAELYREWSRMRDDMECDDLRVSDLVPHGPLVIAVQGME